MKFLPLAVAALLLLALLPLPYAYYMLLRVAVCAGGAFFAYLLWDEKRGLAIALAAAAILFNPFVPAHLTREIWAVLNLIAAGVFGYAGFQLRHRPNS